MRISVNADNREYSVQIGPGMIKEEGLFTGFYFVTFKSYMAFYKVETDRMLVSRVVYGKSDYMRTIFRNAHEK